MRSIFKKELNTYFRSLIGYTFLTIFLVVTAFMFILNNVATEDPDYAKTLNSTTMMFLILIPALTMRLFAEETRQKTDQLLFTSPLSIKQIVFGKFLAALALFLIAMALTMLFPIIIFLNGSLPIANTVSLVAGYVLLITCFISVGLFISSQTENQIIAVVGTFVILFFVFIIDAVAAVMPTGRSASIIFVFLIASSITAIVYNNIKNIVLSIGLIILFAILIGIAYCVSPILFDGVIFKTLTWISLLSRFNNFSLGIFSLSDITYYITFCFLFIYLTISTIEKRRWR